MDEATLARLPSAEERLFGALVRQLRRARGVTQDRLAERCELSTDTIRRLEQGAFSPSLDTLTRICAGLELRRSTLFESFELGERDVYRELVDLLATRAPCEIELATKLLRTLLGLSSEPSQGADWRSQQPKSGRSALFSAKARAETEGMDEGLFGRHVRLLRKARGMTQEALALRSGLSPDTVRRLEYGMFSPSLETLLKLCKGLDLAISTLFATLELGDNDIGRELADLLATRCPRELAVAMRVLRVLFAELDGLASATE